MYNKLNFKDSINNKFDSLLEIKKGCIIEKIVKEMLRLLKHGS